MARCIPSSATDGQPCSEREVFSALSALPDPWIVLGDIPIGLFGRPRPGLVQIDFLVIHPRRGICVLEVKGGQITIDEGTWYSRPRGGEPLRLRRTPFAQAADQRYELQRFLWKHVKVPDEGMAHAVALPHCAVPDALGPDAPRPLVIDVDDLQDIASALDRVLREWRTKLALDDESIDLLVALLKPSATLGIVLASSVKLTEEGLQRETRRQVRFTESQIEAYGMMLRTERTLVLGEAGTGKTVLAVERARRLADTGQRTLLLCHRKAVFSFMRMLVTGSWAHALDPAASELLSLAHWNGLVNELRSASGRKIASEWSPNLVEQVFAASDAAGVKFDALVIDEGQEFNPGQLEALTWLLDDPEHSPLYLFADPFQHSGLFTGAQQDRHRRRGSYRWTPSIDMPVVTLVDNVRNSVAITATAGAFLIEQRAAARVEGPEPEAYCVAVDGDLLSTAVSVIERVTMTDGFEPSQVLVVVIGLAKDDFATQLRTDGLFGVDVADVFRFPLPATDLRLPYGSPDDAQGLEAEVVVVVDRHEPPMTLAKVRDLYVAFSRARSHLIFIGNRSLQALGEGASSAFRAAAKGAQADDEAT